MGQEILLILFLMMHSKLILYALKSEVTYISAALHTFIYFHESQLACLALSKRLISFFRLFFIFSDAKVCQTARQLMNQTHHKIQNYIQFAISMFPEESAYFLTSKIHDDAQRHQKYPSLQEASDYDHSSPILPFQVLYKPEIHESWPGNKIAKQHVNRHSITQRPKESLINSLEGKKTYFNDKLNSILTKKQLNSLLIDS